MYEFDMMGRLYTFYILDNQFHHSIWQWDSNTIVAPSEYTSGRPDSLKTNEDGVSVVDLSTGLEIAYYDMAAILDTSRTARPTGTALVKIRPLRTGCISTKAMLMKRIVC